MNNSSNNSESFKAPPSERFGEAVFPGQIQEIPGGGVVLSKLDDVINWARSNSLWPLTFATSCCGIDGGSICQIRFCKIWI